MDRNSAYGRSGDNEEEDQSQYRQGKASGYEQDGDRERATAGSGGYGNRQRPAGEYEDGGDREESRERSGGGYGRSQKPAGDYEEEEDRDQGYGAMPKSAAKSSAAYGGSGDYEREDEDEDQTREGKFGFGSGSTPEKKAGAKHDDYAEEDEYGEKKSFTGAHKPKPSTGELMSSAKIIAGAVKGGEAVDKAKVSGAASTILSGAKQYGGLDEQGLGGYVSKAEDMLQKYGSGGGGGNDFSGKEKKSDESEESGGYEGRKKPSRTDDGEEEGGSGGGMGGYLKVAQGFMK